MELVMICFKAQDTVPCNRFCIIYQPAVEQLGWMPMYFMPSAIHGF